MNSGVHVNGGGRCQWRVKSVAQLLKQIIHALAWLAQPSLNLHTLQLQYVAPVKQTQDKNGIEERRQQLKKV